MRVFLFVVALLFVSSSSVNGQLAMIPDFQIQNIAGQKVSVYEIIPLDTISILVFWSPDKANSLSQIDLMKQTIEDSLTQQPVKFVAIAIADPGQCALVKPMALARFDDFLCFVDVNRDISRLLGITGLPFTLLIDKKRHIICRRQGYCVGADETVCKEVRSCLQKTD